MVCKFFTSKQCPVMYYKYFISKRYDWNFVNLLLIMLRPNTKYTNDAYKNKPGKSPLLETAQKRDFGGSIHSVFNFLMVTLARKATIEEKKKEKNSTKNIYFINMTYLV